MRFSNYTRSITKRGWSALCLAAVCTLALAAPQRASAGYSVLTTLLGGGNDLIIAHDGNLYGTSGGPRGGIIFKVTPEGQYTTLHSGQSAYLIMQASDGKFYGLVNDSVYALAGFKILVTFHEDGRGFVPISLTEGLHGFLYGSTYGPSRRSPGTIFRIKPEDGDYKKLVNLDLGRVNRGPVGIMTLGRDGNLYGASTDRKTFGPGALVDPSSDSTITPDEFGGGAIFKMTPDGDITTLHEFLGPDGRDPVGPLVQDSATGTFYGATSYGGANPGTGRQIGAGEVFSITPGGDFHVLYSFKAPKHDTDHTNRTGFNPNPVMLASNGYLYGTTTYGGKNGAGVLYRLDKETGDMRVLYDFPLVGSKGSQDQPVGQLVEGDDHILYGIDNSYNYELGTDTGLVFQFNITP